MTDEQVTTEPTTTAEGAGPVADVLDPIDSLPDPDLDDPNSEAYAQAMGDAPAPGPEPESEPEATPEQQAEPEQVLWRREGSRFVKYEAPKVDPPKVEPFRANIYGKDVEAIPGALTNANGDVFIPAAQVGLLNQRLAHATKYPEVQQMRQERAKERQTYAKREEFQGQKFAEIMAATLLNPEWMTWAAQSEQNFATAQLQIKTRLEAAQVEMARQFGALPTTKEEASAPPLDLYEGEAAVTSLLDELLASSDYHGLTADDKQAVMQTLRQRDVPLFHLHPEQGWLLDERPVRALLDARRASRSTTPAKPATPPKAEQAARRNANAVPKPTVPAKPAPKPDAPKDKYADKPWDNPGLSFAEKQKLWRKAKGFGTGT